MLSENHWVFKKHINNLDKAIDVALYLKANKAGVSQEEKKQLFEKLRENQTYRPRISVRDEPLDAMNHRIDMLSYYMFGYSTSLDGQKTFMFSPLGNLFLKYLDDSSKTA
ncbi:MAG: restriction endonuclease, partial [Lactovum sp.]